MSTNNQSVLYSEAPASWNTRYTTPDGFVCQLTLRAENGKDLLEKANAAINWLKEHNYSPSDNNRYPKKQSSAKKVENISGEPPQICPIHQVEMKRWEKDGRIWYSHKVENGWCTGKEK